MRKIQILTILLMPLILSGSILHTIDTSREINSIPDTSEDLGDWIYRKSHTLHGSNGTGTNYQIRFLVHFESGEDSGEDVFCFRQCQPDFDDIRFTDDDETTVLSFWRESYAWADVAVFWVKISDSLDVSATLFMYYGNPSINSGSNGPETFIHFDCFEEGYSGWATTEAQMEELGWTVEPGLRDAVSISNCPDGVSGACLHVVDAVAAFNTDFEIHWTRQDGIAVHMNLYFAEPEDWWRVTFGGGSWAVTSVNFRDGMEFEWCKRSGVVDGSKQWTPSWAIVEDTWHDIEFQATSSTFEIVMDETRHVGGPCENIVSDTEGYSFFVFEGCWGDNYYVDNVYVRKFVTSEPLHGQWLVEPDMVPTLGSEAPPEPIDLGLIAPSFVIGGIIGVIALVFIKRRLDHQTYTPSTIGVDIV